MRPDLNKCDRETVSEVEREMSAALREGREVYQRDVGGFGRARGARSDAEGEDCTGKKEFDAWTQARVLNPFAFDDESTGRASRGSKRLCGIIPISQDDN